MYILNSPTEPVIWCQLAVDASAKCQVLQRYDVEKHCQRDKRQRERCWICSAVELSYYSVKVQRDAEAATVQFTMYTLLA
jgi:hypothetical protein